MQNSSHYTILLYWSFSLKEFEWHLTFLFLALETDLRKSHSSWWRCFVLCYSCKCSNSSWNTCSPLWVTLFLEWTQLPYVCSQCTLLPACNVLRFLPPPPPLYLCFCLQHCDSLASWLWGFFWGKDHCHLLLWSVTTALCTLKICSQTTEKIDWIYLLKKSAGHAAYDCLPDGEATNFVQ